MIPGAKSSANQMKAKAAAVMAKPGHSGRYASARGTPLVMPPA